MVLVGILVMVKDDLHSFDNNHIQGMLVGVASALLFAVRNLLQKYNYADVSADGLILHQTLAVAFMLLLFIDVPAVRSLHFDDWGLLLLLGVISTAMAHSLLSYSLKHLPAKSIAMISCLQPLFATLVAWLVLAEVPSLAVVMGGLIIVSVALYESKNK